VASASRIDELLSRLEAARRQGQPVSPEEICRDCPELRPEVERRLRALEAVGSLLDTPPATEKQPAVAVARSSPQTAGERRPDIAGYEILEQLGRGGMAVVYKARHLQLNRLVALKLILAGAHAGMEALGRFRLEAEAVARLHHPHVVQIYEVGESEGRPYLALEFMEGGSLAQKLAGMPLPARSAAELLETLAHAVHAAHQRGIVHRDLKPANVLLTADGTPKVSDFGLAKQLDSPEEAATSGPAFQTRTGAILGTPSYMAPEQAAGESKTIGPATDVYALGATLYELLTSQPPFRGPTMLDTLDQVRSQEPVPLRRLQPTVPRELESICLKCLAKETANRYASAEQLAGELRRYLSGEPLLLTRPVGKAERLWRWSRRHPAQAAAGGLGAAALVAVAALGIGSLFTLQQARLANRLQEEKEQTQLALQEAQTQRALADEQRRRAEEFRREAQRVSAILALERGRALCEQGETGRGMLWLAHSLEVAPADAADFQRVIRAELAQWYPQLTSLKACLPHPYSIWDAAYSPDGTTVLTGCGDLTTKEGEARLWVAATGSPLDPPLVVQVLWEKGRIIYRVAYSRNGKTVLTASLVEVAQLWDVTTRKPLGVPLLHWQDGIMAVAYSPNGETVLTGTSKKAQVWETATGKPLGPPLTHQGPVLAVAYSPDGRTVLTGSQDKTARLWETATGRPIGPPLPHEDTVWAVAYNPDGRTVLTGSGDGAARQWEVATGKPLGPPLTHQGLVQAVAYSPDGKIVLTGSLDNTARLWEAATGKPIGPPLQHDDLVRTVAFSPDGKIVLTGSRDKTARLWDTATGKLVGPRLPHQELVSAVAFSPDGKMVLTGSLDKTARLWEAVTGKFRRPLLSHHGEVQVVAYSPDGKTIVTASQDKTARLWETASGKAQGPPLTHQGPVTAVAFSPDGTTLLTGSADKTARLWNVATSRPIGAPLQHQDSVTAVAYSPDGKIAVTVAKDKTTRLWDAATGQPIGRPLTHQGAIFSVALSPDGRILVKSGTDRTAQLWDAVTGKPIGSPLARPGPIQMVAFGRDGRRFVTGSQDPSDVKGHVQLWDAATGKPLGPSLTYPLLLRAVALSPDGKTVLVGGMDGTARLWDGTTGKHLGPPLEHKQAVLAVAFSPDGRTLLTGSWDATGRLWDAATGKPLGPPLQHQQPVTAVAFSPDGRTALTGSDDKTARLWEVQPPVAGDVERITLWVQVVSGMELDSDGVVQVLDGPSWQQRRQRLDELGGRPMP
jgi:WD40 repeat protein/tRNA A-37 threonylcarbamoyl transferase component Bud32